MTLFLFEGILFTNARTHYYIGKAFHEKGDIDAAITEYNEALRLDPNLADAHVDLGNALRSKQQSAPTPD